MAEITTQQVWDELEKGVFAVLGMVTTKNEARTVGIVYTVRGRKLYITSLRDTWKVRHISRNPHVSLTAPIHKRIPIMPWIKIPAATITFSGTAAIRDLDELDAGLLRALFRGREEKEEYRDTACVIEVEPQGEFITYGVGVSLMTMRDTTAARGRVHV